MEASRPYGGGLLLFSTKEEMNVNLFVIVLSHSLGRMSCERTGDELGIAENSDIVGPVPHDQVAPFYDLIDVFVVSRPYTRVTQLVTPLETV